MNAKFKAENEIQGAKIKQYESIMKEWEDAYWELNVKYVNITKS